MASDSPSRTALGSSAAPQSAAGDISTRQAVPPKNVAFELLFPETSCRARLPMRVQIFPHDTTDSIVTTVKNFYGLYSSPTSSRGVSFEDQDGNTLIARYENFHHQMVVYVRVTEESSPASNPFATPSYNPPAAAATAPSLYGSETLPLQASPRFSAEMSRPASRSSQSRSPSPNGGRGRRSASANSSKTRRSRSVKQNESVANDHAGAYIDSMNGYSSGDGASSSSSSRTKEQIGNTEISVDNIVEGGRRKRAKFESSELPLFAPPQMPAATSNPSVSPVRRAEYHRPSLPFVQPAQHPFTTPHPLQTPQNYTAAHSHSGYYATPLPDSRRTRASIGYAGQGNNISGVLPTPDPTVGSCVSEEDKDVAIQLMRLGEMSNISHGRTSASTLDDTFSGRADAASSTGATSDGECDSEEGLPESRRQKLDAAGTMRKIYHTTESHFMPQNSGEASGDDADYEDGMDDPADGVPKPEALRTEMSQADDYKHKAPSPTAKAGKSTKAQKAPRPALSVKGKKAPVTITNNGPMSPASMPPSRKQSIVSGTALPLAVGDDEQVDLSAKPRCQRCRKSKKGCDRQRPCGRCRDAGLCADQCISEDEGNGRKGRYGRHMGVPITKEEIALAAQQPSLLPAAPISLAANAGDKQKKRKR